MFLIGTMAYDDGNKSKNTAVSNQLMSGWKKRSAWDKHVTRMDVDRLGTIHKLRHTLRGEGVDKL